MLKNKFLLLSLIVLLSGIPVNAVTLSELDYPKPPFYRVGISELPENQYVQAKQKKAKIEKTYAKIDDSMESNVMDMTYADLSIKHLSKEIAQELEFEEQDMIADLSLLWQGAAMQSDTINFALYKLANPDADKPDSKSIKKVLTTIASMSTLVGASMANPIFAGSSLIGGNILNIMSQDTKALNYKYTRVTDADMIILIRKIEDLQQNAVNLYYDYMSAKKQLEMTNKLVEERQRKFELAQKNNAQRELIVITDAYYRTAIDKQRTAKAEFFSKRAALEQFVGNETFVQFESELEARERGESTKSLQQSQDKNTNTEPAYAQTIENVENYTKDLKNKDVQTLDTVQTEIPDENPDQNLDKVPALKPLDSDNNIDKDITAENENSIKKENGKMSELKSKFSEKFSAKPVKSEAKTEKLNKELKNDNIKIKNSSKNSKGLNFLKKDKNIPETTDNFLPLDSVSPKLEKTDVDSTLNLEPLDEIKAPELRKDGYSIYSEGNE